MLTFGNADHDPFVGEAVGHGLQEKQALAREATARNDSLEGLLVFSRSLEELGQPDGLGPYEEVRLPKQTPRLGGLESFEQSQLVHDVVRYGEHLAGACVLGQALSHHRLSPLHRQGAVVAELDAFPEGLALAGVGLLDVGRSGHALLVRVLHGPGQVSAALDGGRRVGGRERPARRQRRGADEHGPDPGADWQGRPRQAPP